MKKILIVEDDQIVANIYRNKFTVEGFVVEVAGDGHSGLELAESFRPDAIILDLMLPKMTGEEFRAVQLANGTLKNIPVVVVSAHPHGEAIATRMNVDAFLPKPVDFGAFASFVNRHARH